jgi:hypothetical protein
MNSRSKIIGLTRQMPEPHVDASEHDYGPETVSDAGNAQFSDASPDPEAPVEYYEDYAVPTEGRSVTSYILPSLLIIACIAWTAFFGWTYFPEIQSRPANERVADLIAIWAAPTLLLAVIWLIAMRNSSREASRFGDVSLQLRTESEALAQRMRTVNEEISIAREFLAQNARELESVGRQSARQLMESADALASALADSDEKAKTLEAVSNAANSNLEQLRKHLPVVTGAAKDVTNQIGSAGNNAQLQIKALIAALERVGETGKLARDYIDNMERRADEVGDKLEQSLNSSATLLDERSTEAVGRATEMATIIDRTVTGMVNGVTDASTQVDTLFSTSRGKIEDKLARVRESLTLLSDKSAEEETRINAIIGEIAAHIESSASRIAEIDRNATDQTAKLAFAVSALGESTKDVGAALNQNKDVTEHLIIQSGALLESLGQANHELDAALPAALDRLEQRLSGADSQLLKATSAAGDLNDMGEAMVAKLIAVEQLVGIQRDNVTRLMAEGDEQFAVRQEQADALAASLTQTRALIAEMAEEANNKLVTSMLHVRETTSETAEHSRKIVDEELSNIADRLTEQNQKALSEAVDVQIATMNAAVTDAINRNVSLSQDAATRVATQLGELEEMTARLEQRIQASTNRFEAIDDDSFARRMVLLTESLNSTAIDVAKILSNDVTDTAWAAYLKGDRGVFTRRAVRLLDAGEARAIASHYSEDSEFREHVNRYIHDFESMMRVLLSTRDGNAIGVTLLSSDVGKLYVALAQAIERLRN